MGTFYYEIQYEEGCDLYEEIETPKGTPESEKKTEIWRNAKNGDGSISGMGNFVDIYTDIIELVKRGKPKGKWKKFDLQLRINK